MENARLWQILALLTPLERKHLHQWLLSPFFNRREQPLALFQYLQICLDANQAPEQGAAHQAVY